MQIGIDTSTDFASLALADGPEVLAELTWRCGQNHTVELFPRLSFMLEKAGQPVLDAVFVALGPGSFNGLRVGVAAAKGLAYGLGIPILGVGTLETLAYQHSAGGEPVCALQAAGREEVAVAIYQMKPRKGWTQLAGEHITTLDALEFELKDTTIVCGEFDLAMTAQIKRVLGKKVILPPAAFRLRRAAYLIELGGRKLKGRDYDPVATLQPLYLRKPPITERKKQ